MTHSDDFRNGDPARIEAVLREIAAEPDRSVAVVGGSLVEAALTRALVASLHPEEELSHELFQPSGPVGAFHAKIDLGRLTGLYGRAAHRDLVIVKEIRNDFAHRPEVSSFADQRMRDLANNLTLAERYVAEAAAGAAGGESEGDDARPLAARASWFAVEGRDALLANGRGRFILTVRALAFALARAGARRMPDPAF